MFRLILRQYRPNTYFCIELLFEIGFLIDGHMSTDFTNSF